MIDLGGALVDRVRARLEASKAVSGLFPPGGMEALERPRLRLATPDMVCQGQGPIRRLEIALTIDCFADERHQAFYMGRAAMAAISPMKYRLRASRGAALVLRWRGDYHGTEADEDGLWHYGQRFAATGIAG